MSAYLHTTKLLIHTVTDTLKSHFDQQFMVPTYLFIINDEIDLMPLRLKRNISIIALIIVGPVEKESAPNALWFPHNHHHHLSVVVALQ